MTSLTYFISIIGGGLVVVFSKYACGLSQDTSIIAGVITVSSLLILNEIWETQSLIKGELK